METSLSTNKLITIKKNDLVNVISFAKLKNNENNFSGGRQIILYLTLKGEEKLRKTIIKFVLRIIKEN